MTLNQVPALASLAPLRDARRLASLGVLGVKHLGVQDFEPLVGLPSLAHLRLGLGSVRKHAGVRALLGL